MQQMASYVRRLLECTFARETHTHTMPVQQFYFNAGDEHPAEDYVATEVNAILGEAGGQD
jgi:hypothetical protein